jgi:hypothetical protein
MLLLVMTLTLGLALGPVFSESMFDQLELKPTIQTTGQP